jgi:hypothetical protein
MNFKLGSVNYVRHFFLCVSLNVVLAVSCPARNSISTCCGSRHCRLPLWWTSGVLRTCRPVREEVAGFGASYVAPVTKHDHYCMNNKSREMGWMRLRWGHHLNWQNFWSENLKGRDHTDNKWNFEGTGTNLKVRELGYEEIFICHG